MTVDEQIAAFNSERNEAMLSLDEQKIREFFREWNKKELPADMNVFWGAVHKTITGIRSLPLDFRQRSKDYLTGRGLQSLDDDELTGKSPISPDASKE